MAEKKFNVLPGFGLTMGYTLLYLGALVLIPIGALFLKRFVTRSRNWLHGDVYGWNPKERPGRPVGADPHTVRALYRLIRQRFG